MDIRNHFYHGLNIVKQNLPTILTATALVGVGLTAFLTGTATLEADKKIAEAEDLKGDLLTNEEKLKVVYPCYIPAAAAGIATSMCIVGAHLSHTAQLATVITAARKIEQQLQESRDSAVSVFGDRGLRKIDEATNKKNFGLYFGEPSNIYDTGQGTVLCCEGFLTGLLFRASIEWVHKCVNDFNKRLIDGESLSFNEFLLMLIPGLNVDLLPNAGWIFGHDLDRDIPRRRMLEIVEDSFILASTNEVGYIFNLRQLPMLDYKIRYDSV